MQELNEELVERIGAKIDWEGLDEYLTGGWAEEDFDGTHLASAHVAYLEAREALLALLSDAGVEV